MTIVFLWNFHKHVVEWLPALTCDLKFRRGWRNRFSFI